MKKIFFISIIFFTYSFSFSQNEITVHLKNNQTISGSGKLKRTFVKLKTSNDSKSKKIDLKEIDKIDCKENNKITTFYFFKSNKGNYIRTYLQLIIIGKVNLYAATFMNVTGFGAYETTKYYLKRDNETIVTELGGGTVWENFKKESEEYFKDCPILVKKILESKKGFAKKDVKDIVNYYNSKCD